MHPTRPLDILLSKARSTNLPTPLVWIRSPFVLLNDTQVDPDTGRPFSTRAMRKCLTEGAARFGWEKRTPEPCSMRDGRYLIGQGMACAIYTHWRWPAQARVTLNCDGTALVEAGTHDIGTGTYTVFQQIVADTLGLPREKSVCELVTRGCLNLTRQSGRPP